MKYVLAAVGAILYLLTTLSVVKTLVIPRGRLPRIPLLIDHALEFIYAKVCSLTRSYERRDSIRASQAAALIFLDLLVWVCLYLLAFSMMMFPALSSFPRAVREAGASLLTLGFVSTPTPWATTVDFLAGFTGLVIVALQISYLPTLYAAFNRRETEVTLLSSRVGDPPWGPEFLARTRIGFVDTEVLGIYRAWERWSADVAESHATYPVLLRFRSPSPYASWVVSLLAVLDSAALYLSLAPSEAPVEARLALRMGFECLRKVAVTVGIPYDSDPSPTDPLELSFDEFCHGVDRIRSSGFPIERSDEEAWKHFRGWRVNYEAIAYRLAQGIDAVPALWSGPRLSSATVVDTRRVINRTPEHPTGESPRPRNLDE